MSDTQPKYTAMELAELIGVPRTTINDWLTRYERYIFFKLQGKRKVYTDSTVAVLREISELRNQGLSSFDIEEELAKRHPMRGEIAPEPTATEGGEPSLAPVLRSQITEMTDLLRNSLLDLQRRFVALEQEQRRAAARAWRWSAVTALLAILLVLLAALAAVKLQREIEARLASDRLRLQSDTAIGQMEQELGRQLAREQQLESDLARFKQELADQQQQFQERLEALRQKAESARQAALLEQRDEFARSRLELLGQLDAARQDRDRLGQLLQQLQEQIAAQNRLIRRLGETEPATPPPPASLAPELP